jgi:hypothetical protein
MFTLILKWCMPLFCMTMEAPDLTIEQCIQQGKARGYDVVRMGADHITISCIPTIPT